MKTAGIACSIWLALALGSIPMSAMAQDDPLAQEGGSGGTFSDPPDQPPQEQTSEVGVEEADIMAFESVEDLNADIDEYDGRRVKVSGEIARTMDDRSFVLESGGAFDEITVLVPEDFEGLEAGQEVEVTGTIRTDRLAELEDEVDWDYDSEIEDEVEDARGFLIADDISE